MLTYEDWGTIRNAIIKRLDKEPGVQIADIVIRNKPDEKPPYIQVGVWLVLTSGIMIDSVPDLRAWFDLPASFDYKQLHNEIDEISESAKAAMKRIGVGRLIWTPGAEQRRQVLPGTGLRGRWLQHAS